MDIFEILFEKITKSKRQKGQSKKTTVFFKDISKYLHIVSQYHSQGLLQNQMHSGLKNCGYINNEIFFPDMISCFPSKNINLSIYKNLALVNSLIKKNKLVSKLSSRSNTAYHLETLKHWNLLKTNIVIDFKISKLSVFHKDVYSVWRKIYIENHDANLFLSEIDSLIKRCKYNDDVPDFLFYTIPHLEIKTGHNATFKRELMLSDAIINEKKNERKDTQIHQNSKLQEEEANTIMHSFEKTETLDDYDGKKRFVDGDDDLDDHLQALDEVQVSQAADKQQETKSIFRSDFLGNDKSEVIFSQKASEALSDKKIFIYPEWSYKKKSYIQNYCKVYEQCQFADDRHNESKFLTLPKYKNKVIKWERQIQNLFNKPAWIKRQLDGQDLDIDEVVRYVSSIQFCDSGHQKIYQNKEKLLKDMSIVVLFDSSLSTDSYVKGVRIFDIITESINILADIFPQLPIRIQIASTNSLTHNQINYNIIKNYSDNWSKVKYQMSLQQPEGYTRLGPAIRHASTSLENEKANHKLMVLVTDGKPTDMDEYEGRRGIEDITKALRETESKGIYTWGMAIEATDKSYFRSMFPSYSLVVNPEYFTDELIKILLKLCK